MFSFEKDDTMIWISCICALHIKSKLQETYKQVNVSDEFCVYFKKIGF